MSARSASADSTDRPRSMPESLTEAITAVPGTGPMPPADVVRLGAITTLTAGAPAATDAASEPSDAVGLRFACVGPALASSLLLWLCFFPLAWGWLAWVALVPLMALVRSQARPRIIYFVAYLGGLTFFLPALQWMSVADQRMIYTWLMLAFYCALYYPLAILLLRKLDQRTAWPLTVTLPVAWVGLEFVRSFLLTGFAWYYLGHSQHDYLALTQIADLGGAYAVSLLVAIANGLAFECLYAAPRLRMLFRQREPITYLGAGYRFAARNVAAPGLSLLRQAAAFALLLIATPTYGGWRLSQQEAAQGPIVSLLQSNLDQRIRNEAYSAAAKAKGLEQYYLALCGHAVRQHPAPHLLVWPETAYPYPWWHARLSDLADDPGLQDAIVTFQEHIRGHVRFFKVPQLLGINAKEWLGPKRYKQYNAAMLFNEDGNLDGRYDKVHRVPFGEYVPFRDWLPLMNAFAPYDFDYGVLAGEKLARIPLTVRHGTSAGIYHFGVLICYEDTDPFLARAYGRHDADGPAVDFLLNISNDGWFDGTREHDEHLAISRFRAIEARRAVGRAVNMGISAVIDGNGRVLKPMEVRDAGGIKLWAIQHEYGEFASLPVGEWPHYKKADGVLVAAMPIDRRFSLYAHLGRWYLSDWLPLACWAGILGVLVVSLFHGRGTKKLA